jgi:hypothetical protein
VWPAARRCTGIGWRSLQSVRGGQSEEVGRICIRSLCPGLAVTSQSRVAQLAVDCPLPSFAAPALRSHTSVPRFPFDQEPVRRSLSGYASLRSKAAHCSDAIPFDCLTLPSSRLTAHCLQCNAIYLLAYPVICPFVRLIVPVPSLTRLKPRCLACISCLPVCRLPCWAEAGHMIWPSARIRSQPDSSVIRSTLPANSYLPLPPSPT